MGKASSKLSQQHSGKELVTENKVHVKNFPTIAFLGLDNSGKTSIIEYMAAKTFHYCPPTQLKALKTTIIANFLDSVTFEAVDVPGGNKLRGEIWIESLKHADYVAFVVDASDTLRCHFALTELLKYKQYLLGKSIVVLINKTDLLDTNKRKDYINADFDRVLHEAIDVLSKEGNAQGAIFEVSALGQKGILDAMTWLFASHLTIEPSSAVSKLSRNDSFSTYVSSTTQEAFANSK